MNFSEDDGVTGHARANVLIDWRREWRVPFHVSCMFWIRRLGELAWEEFTEKVVSCKVDTNLEKIPGR